MTDTDLRALERATEKSPEDGAAWLARALGAARVGARDEALGCFYRAAALGAELRAVRGGLRALGAPPTPWSHDAGDARRSRCSPLTGPRRGEIVARAPLPKANSVVIAEDGTVLVGQSGGTIARFEGRSLRPLGEITLDGTWTNVWPTAGAGLVVATTSGNDSGLYAIDGTSVRCHEITGPGEQLATPVIEGERVLVLRAREVSTIDVSALDASLGLLRRLDAGSYAGDLVVSDNRISFVNASGRHYASLRNISLSGASLPGFVERELDARAVEAPVVDALGRLLVATESGYVGGGSMNNLSAFDAAGAEAWRVPFFTTEGGFARVAATPDGGAWLVTDSEVHRIEPGGRVAWSDDFASHGRGVVSDSEGVLYRTDVVDWKATLVAVGPDREKLFEISERPFTPVGIDAWGRLLAVHHGATPALGEIVAIA